MKSRVLTRNFYSQNLTFYLPGLLFKMHRSIVALKILKGKEFLYTQRNDGQEGHFMEEICLKLI